MILVVSAVLWALLTVPCRARGTPKARRPTRGEHRSRRRHAIEPATGRSGSTGASTWGSSARFGAREVMVGTMGVISAWKTPGRTPHLFPRGSSTRRSRRSPAYTKRTALALLAFFLLACQCMSTLFGR